MLQQMRSSAKWIWAFIVITFVGVFLFAETSGLLGVGPAVITPGTAVAKVNGVEILYLQWMNLSNALAQQEERQIGRGLTLDERNRVEDQAFEQLVSEILLRQEYQRRGIRVSDQEVVEAAQSSPPPELMQNPELQTDGRFDLEKYRRLLGSPAARQQGLLLQLENFYRSEIPKAKLFDQLAGDVYVSDSKLWSVYRDLNDSAQVSFVRMDAAEVPDSAISIPDTELRAHYTRNRDRYERPGRAVVTVLTIPRTVSGADTAAARQRVVALREEIEGGASFEDVARRESADTISGADGGSLGSGVRGRFVPQFEDAAYALPVGRLSEPVLTNFGYHLIRVDSRKGDSLSLRHILLRIGQSDSSAARTDRRADSLARIAASQEEPSRLDSAAKVLGLPPEAHAVIEGEPLLGSRGTIIPSVSAWAFSGVRRGETSDLFDSADGYFLARLDSIFDGGVPRFEDVREEIRAELITRKKAETLVPKARQLALEAASSTLEQSATAAGTDVSTSEMFSRPQFVAGLGRFNPAIGAAFSLPVGAVSEPLITDDAVIVLRVDRRVPADSAAWREQVDRQRQDAIGSIRQLRVRTFLSELRKNAKVTDNRKEINAAARADDVATGTG